MNLKYFLNFFVILLSTNLFAAEKLNINKYLINFNYGKSYFRYDEYNKNNNILDTEKNKRKLLNSFSLKIQKSVNNKYIFGINFNYTYGKTQYIGRLQNGTPYKGKLKKTYIIEPSVFINQIYKNNIIKFLFGYRYWDRGYNKNDPADYNEKYYWYYIGIGYIHKVYINKNISTNIEFQFKQALSPKMKVYLFNNPVIKLGNTYGYSINIPLNFSLNKQINIGLFYNVGFWKISKSKIQKVDYDSKQYFIFEPKSRTIKETIGININYKF